MKTETKWLKFEEYDLPGKVKTRAFFVSNKQNGNSLGKIKWYGPFRKYSFFPREDLVFESTCLKDISEFLLTLMKERLAARAIEKAKDWKARYEEAVIKESQLKNPNNNGDKQRLPEGSTEQLERVRVYAKKNGFTDQYIADAMGCNRTYIVQLFGLKVVPRLDTFLRLCDVVGASPTGEGAPLNGPTVDIRSAR